MLAIDQRIHPPHLPTIWPFCSLPLCDNGNVYCYYCPRPVACVLQDEEIDQTPDDNCDKGMSNKMLGSGGQNRRRLGFSWTSFPSSCPGAQDAWALHSCLDCRVLWSIPGRPPLFPSFCQNCTPVPTTLTVFEKEKSRRCVCVHQETFDCCGGAR
jgi:hypothetical protein